MGSLTSSVEWHTDLWNTPHKGRKLRRLSQLENDKLIVENVAAMVR